MLDATEWLQMAAELKQLDATARKLRDASDRALAAGEKPDAERFSDAYHAAIRDRNAAMLRWWEQGWGPTDIGRCFEQTMRRTYVSRLIAQAREDLRTGKTSA